MKKIKKMVLLSIFLMFSKVVSAEPWSTLTNVIEVYPNTVGLVFVTSYANTQISTCDNGKRFSISKDHPNYDVMASAMLAAFMADEKIVFHIESGQNGCQPTIDRFRVLK